jgi:hypothetical protein
VSLLIKSFDAELIDTLSLLKLSGSGMKYKEKENDPHQHRHRRAPHLCSPLVMWPKEEEEKAPKRTTTVRIKVVV